MGCQILAAVDTASGHPARLLELVPDWFERWEAALSRFRPDSELNQINRQPGVQTPVSKTLWGVLQAARTAESQSEGLVTPIVLDAMIAAGYTTSFDRLEQAEAPPSSTKAVPPTFSLQDVAFEPKKYSLRLPVGMRLDLGGVAKGWAAQQAMRRLEKDGPALVDAGGDIAVSGPKAGGQPWLVGIDDPRHEGESLGTLRLGRCGVATSGRDRRRWQQNGRWKHHIIDPRTGEPALTDVLTATVIAPNVMEAETAAKVVFILGSRDGLDWLEHRAGFSGLVVSEDGAVFTSGALRKMM